ncbi:MAG: adenylosuccinate synthase [Deltaproteobacteria bacterium]|nr:MAG: adenylosuccinate synthase [Deltaproteobacteria bacterium]
MPVVCVVGAQWGDEGKGKVVDLYAQYADVVVRYGGGANAGHTLVVGGEKVVLHLVPSGALQPRAQCVIGQGTVLDPKVLLDEIDELERRDLAPERVFVSDRAHVVLPHHKLIDGLREADAGAGAIGTTKRGIGPCYEDKVARRGIRIGDLVDAKTLGERVRANIEAWRPVIAALGGEVPDVDAIVQLYAEYGGRLRPFITDTAKLLWDAMKDGKNVLLEGAQGAMLDVDHGTYPYVTSSTVLAGGACAGAGLGPTAIDRVVGITKAYTTRVGGGPFPTELHGEDGERLRKAGNEFGATTGRPRRCGWLDIPALRFAVQINGMSELAVTKLDILAGLGDISICTHYEGRDGTRYDTPPYDGLEDLTPVYEKLPGWTEDLTKCETIDDLPDNARSYIRRIEELADAKVGMVSVGADRTQTLRLRDPFG